MTIVKHESFLRIRKRTLGYGMRYVQVTILYGIQNDDQKLIYTNLKIIILEII